MQQSAPRRWPLACPAALIGPGADQAESTFTERGLAGKKRALQGGVILKSCKSC